MPTCKWPACPPLRSSAIWGRAARAGPRARHTIAPAHPSPTVGHRKAPGGSQPCFLSPLFSSSQEPCALGALPSTANTRPPQRSLRSSSSPPKEGLKAALCPPPQCHQQPGDRHSPDQAVLQHRGHCSCPGQPSQPFTAQLRAQGSPPAGMARPRFLSLPVSCRHLWPLTSLLNFLGTAHSTASAAGGELGTGQCGAPVSPPGKDGEGRAPPLQPCPVLGGNEAWREGAQGQAMLQPPVWEITVSLPKALRHTALMERGHEGLTHPALGAFWCCGGHLSVLRTAGAQHSASSHPAPCAVHGEASIEIICWAQGWGCRAPQQPAVLRVSSCPCQQGQAVRAQPAALHSYGRRAASLARPPQP